MPAPWFGGLLLAAGGAGAASCVVSAAVGGDGGSCRCDIASDCSIRNGEQTYIKLVSFVRYLLVVGISRLVKSVDFCGVVYKGKELGLRDCCFSTKFTRLRVDYIDHLRSGRMCEHCNKLTSRNGYFCSL